MHGETWPTEAPYDVLVVDDNRALAAVVADSLEHVDGRSLATADSTETPFIVFTNRRDDHTAADAREQGGRYLRKQTDSDQYQRLAALVHEQAGGD